MINGNHGYSCVAIITLMIYAEYREGWFKFEIFL